MGELVILKYTEHKTNVEIECLQPSKCSSTFKCSDIKFLSLQMGVFYLCQALYLWTFIIELGVKFGLDLVLE